jgi:NADPH:quinone reductase-like Zn-dependent oxidoreductase
VGLTWVRLRATYAAAHGLVRPGDVVVAVTEDEAQALVAGGYAERLTAPAERAVAAPAAERAVAARPGRPGGRA